MLRVVDCPQKHTCSIPALHKCLISPQILGTANYLISANYEMNKGNLSCAASNFYKHSLLIQEQWARELREALFEVSLISNEGRFEVI